MRKLWGLLVTIVAAIVWFGAEGAPADDDYAQRFRSMDSAGW